MRLLCQSTNLRNFMYRYWFSWPRCVNILRYILPTLYLITSQLKPARIFTMPLRPILISSPIYACSYKWHRFISPSGQNICMYLLFTRSVLHRLSISLIYPPLNMTYHAIKDTSTLLYFPQWAGLFIAEKTLGPYNNVIEPELSLHYVTTGMIHTGNNRLRNVMKSVAFYSKKLYRNRRLTTPPKKGLSIFTWEGTLFFLLMGSYRIPQPFRNVTSHPKALYLWRNNIRHKGSRNLLDQSIPERTWLLFP